MPKTDRLLANNRAWSAQVHADDPTFFSQLAHQQSPEYLWIGCSDSRVPANEIVGLLPGEVFVHRNVANVVVHTDLNCLSVLQYGVDVIKVSDVLVVGHYGCGGVLAALQGLQLGLIDNWLRHIQDVRLKHTELIESLPDQERHNRLCELNVIEQVVNVCQTTVVQEAWNRGQSLTVRGWIYSVADGLIRDLGIVVDNNADLPPAYTEAVRVCQEARGERPVCATN